MNNTFSLHRVARYARKHYVENGRTYVYGILITTAITAFMLYIAPYQNHESLLLPLLFGTVYFTLACCGDHYHPRSMELNYMLPASQAEKYLFTWFNSALLATAVSVAVIWIVSTVFTAIGNKPVGPDFSQFEYSVAMPAIAAYFLLQAAILFSCCRGKGTPLKGLLILIAIFAAASLAYFLSLRPAFGSNFSIDLLDASCQIHSGTARIGYPLIEGVSLSTSIAQVFGFWTLVLWVTAYFKFRERTSK